MHKIKGPSMVDYTIPGYFISLIKCIIINASSSVHLSSKLHTFGQFQQLSCNIIHKSWHKKTTNADDLFLHCHEKKDFKTNNFLPTKNSFECEHLASEERCICFGRLTTKLSHQ